MTSNSTYSGGQSSELQHSNRDTLWGGIREYFKTQPVLDFKTTLICLPLRANHVKDEVKIFRSIVA